MAKLLKMSKYRLPCIDLMQTMLSRASEDIYFSKNPNNVDDVLKAIQTGIKDRKERMIFLGYVINFISKIHPDFIRKDGERINGFIKTCAQQVFQKKTAYNQEECALIEKFLIQYSAKSFHSTIPIIEEVINTQNYSSFTIELRITCFKALSTIAENLPNEISSYNYLLGPFLITHILDEKSRKDLPLLISMIKCFPRIKHQSEEKMKEVLNYLGTLMLHPSDDIKDTVHLVMNNYVNIEVTKFNSVIEIYTNILMNYETLFESIDELFKIIHNVKKIIDTFIMKYHESSNLGMDTNIIISSFKKVETVCLMWLCHFDYRIRSEIYKILKDMKRNELISILKDTNSHINVIDHLKAPVSQTFQDVWLNELTEYLLTQSNDIIDGAWIQIESKQKYLIENITKTPNTITILSNNLLFLSLSIRPEKFEASNKFFDLLINLLTTKYGQTHQNLHEKVLYAASNLNNISIDWFIARIKEYPIQRIMNKKKTKVEAQDQLHEKNILDVLSNLISKLEYKELFQKSKTKDYVEEIISNWIINEKNDLKNVMGSMLKKDTWKMASKILSLYINLLKTACINSSNDPKPDFVKEAPNHSSIVKDLGLIQFKSNSFKFINLDHPLAIVDTCGVKVVTALLSLGPTKDNFFIDEIMRYFHNILKSSEFKNEVIDAMSMMLKNNSNLLDTFIKSTYFENLNKISNEIKSEDFSIKVVKGSKEENEKKEKTKEDALKSFNSSIQKMNLCYFTAICNVLEVEIDNWLKENDFLGRITFISLLNMVSPTMEIRNTGLRLMKILCLSKSTKFNMGKLLFMTTTFEERIYNSTTMRLSQYISTLNPMISFHLFEEANTSIDILNYQYWNDLLFLITPWSRNYGYFVKSNDQNSEKLLKTIYQITNKLHGRFPEQIESLWIQLIKSRDITDQVCENVTDFITEEYRNVIFKNPQDKELLKNISLYISRDPKSLIFILNNLILKLRDYKEIIPTSQEEVVKWMAKRNITLDAKHTSTELSVLQILVNLTYESDLTFISHLPVIFLNMVILFNSSQTQLFPEAKEILQHLYQSLGIRYSEKNNLEECLEFQKKYFQGNLKYSREKEFIRGWIGQLSQHQKNLSSDIANLSLEWAIKSEDSKIQLESLYVFYHLNDDYDFSLLETLSILLFDSVRSRNDEKIFILLKILESFPTKVMTTVNYLRFYLSLPFWLLFSWNKKHFQLSLDIILNVIEKPPKEIDTNSLNQIFFEVWNTGNDEVDIIISQLLLKGLTSNDTFYKTLELFEKLSQCYKKNLPKNNFINLTNLLIQAILLLSSDYHKKECLNLLKLEDILLNNFESIFNKYESIKMDSKSIDSFIDEFSISFGKIFPTKGGYYISFLLSYLLQNGKSQWQIPCISLLSKLLPIIFDINWKYDEYKDLINIFKECMYDQDEIFKKSSELGMEFLIKSLIPNQIFQIKTDEDRKKLLNFMNKPIQGYENSIKGITYENRDLFIGGQKNEKENSRFGILIRIWQFIFGLKNIEELKQMMNETNTDNIDEVLEIKRKESQISRKAPNESFAIPKIDQKEEKEETVSTESIVPIENKDIEEKTKIPKMKLILNQIKEEKQTLSPSSIQDENSKLKISPRISFHGKVNEVDPKLSPTILSPKERKNQLTNDDDDDGPIVKVTSSGRKSVKIHKIE